MYIDRNVGRALILIWLLPYSSCLRVMERILLLRCFNVFPYLRLHLCVLSGGVAWSGEYAVAKPVVVGYGG